MPGLTENKPLDRLNELLSGGTYNQVRTLIQILKPADIAALLESSPPKERTIIWKLVEQHQQSEILQELNEELVSGLLADISPDEIVHLLEQVESDDDLTDILQQLPNAITHQLLRSMGTTDRARVENLLSYAENTAGGLMDTETISVRARVTLDVVLRYLRRHTELPAMTDNVFVVNRNDEYLGTLSLSRLLVSDPNLTVREMMETNINPIPSDMHESEVAAIFARYDLVSAPVIDQEGNLLGRITIDDVVDVIKDEADHSLLSMAGLTEEDDTFAPIIQTAKSRTLWLGANLITALIASSVISVFEDTIAKVIALAVLMPIVASMGGVAGSQTLTLLIRSMAQGQLAESNQRWLVRRELAVGAINGIVWSIVVAAAATLVFNDVTLGLVIALALIINLITAAFAGATLPSVLRSLNIDPAVAGTVLLTTITDVVGFLSFLGLATLFYAR
ncbi:MAG: magnesium transporter [Pseudomonadales bacterium]|nr:magnesium transporter [Pseudomonadales bacterium]